MRGMSTIELASLTGVSEGAVAHYVDLTPAARAGIDAALAPNPTLNGFGRISVTELQSRPGYAAKNEYEQVIGLLDAPQDCASCPSRGGKPLACYPCQNFKPFVDADHHEASPFTDCHGWYETEEEARKVVNHFRKPNSYRVEKVWKRRLK